MNFLLPEAYGTFLNVDDYIFRTEAYLQWGKYDKLLGLIIMLNPGKSQLIDQDRWFKLEQGQVDCVSGKLVLDDTMKAVAYIFSKAYHLDFQGRLVIKNLFNLRNPDSNDAITTYQNVLTDESFSHALYSKFEFEMFPWVWLAWGIDDNKELKKRKQEVFSRIPSSMHRFYI